MLTKTKRRKDFGVGVSSEFIPERIKRIREYKEIQWELDEYWRKRRQPKINHEVLVAKVNKKWEVFCTCDWDITVQSWNDAILSKESHERRIG